MNQAHIHLLITHLPIFGSILGALVLVHGLWMKSNQTIIAAYNLFIISSIGAGIAYLTGEGAEESVEDLQGIIKETIKQHEEFAMFALISLIMLGIVSVFGLYVAWKKPVISRTTAFGVLFLSLISFGLVARTGYLGGQIRHTEINTPINSNAAGEKSNSDRD